MTRKEMFEKLMTIADVKADTALFEAVEKGLKSEIKKAESRKPTENQKQNEQFKLLIVDVLESANSPMRVAEIQNLNEELAKLSNQKMSALLSALIKDDKVVRISEKKIAKFAIIH